MRNRFFEALPFFRCIASTSKNASEPSERGNQANVSEAHSHIQNKNTKELRLPLSIVERLFRTPYFDQFLKPLLLVPLHLNRLIHQQTIQPSYEYESQRKIEAFATELGWLADDINRFPKAKKNGTRSHLDMVNYFFRLQKYLGYMLGYFDILVGMDIFGRSLSAESEAAIVQEIRVARSLCIVASEQLAEVVSFFEVLSDSELNQVIQLSLDFLREANHDSVALQKRQDFLYLHVFPLNKYASVQKNRNVAFNTTYLSHPIIAFCMQVYSRFPLTYGYQYAYLQSLCNENGIVLGAAQLGVDPLSTRQLGGNRLGTSQIGANQSGSRQVGANRSGDIKGEMAHSALDLPSDITVYSDHPTFYLCETSETHFKNSLQRKEVLVVTHQGSPVFLVKLQDNIAALTLQALRAQSGLVLQPGIMLAFGDESIRKAVLRIITAHLDDISYSRKPKGIESIELSVLMQNHQFPKSLHIMNGWRLYDDKRTSSQVTNQVAAFILHVLTTYEKSTRKNK